MGRIKSKLVKRVTLNLLKENNDFSENFDHNKGLIKGLTESKKTRNQIAGNLARKKKAEFKRAN